MQRQRSCVRAAAATAFGASRPFWCVRAAAAAVFGVARGWCVARPRRDVRFCWLCPLLVCRPRSVRRPSLAGFRISSAFGVSSVFGGSSVRFWCVVRLLALRPWLARCPQLVRRPLLARWPRCLWPSVRDGVRARPRRWCPCATVSALDRDVASDWISARDKLFRLKRFCIQRCGFGRSGTVSTAVRLCPLVRDVG